MTNQVLISNLIDVINGVFLSLELIVVTIIINAANNKYLLKLSWNNVEINKSGFI